jgi:hypothetical protein
VPHPALPGVHRPGLDRPLGRPRPEAEYGHGYAFTPSVRRLRSALSDRVRGAGPAHPDPELVDPVTRKLMRFGSVVFSIRNSIIGIRSQSSEVC